MTIVLITYLGEYDNIFAEMASIKEITLQNPMASISTPP